MLEAIPHPDVVWRAMILVRDSPCAMARLPRLAGRHSWRGVDSLPNIWALRPSMSFSTSAVGTRPPSAEEDLLCDISTLRLSVGRLSLVKLARLVRVELLSVISVGGGMVCCFKRCT